jgi:hypothetical protein
MPFDEFESLDEPFQNGPGAEEKAEKLLKESGGNEDPDSEN